MYFDVKAGLVPGRNHLIDGKNCQDAFSLLSGQINEDPFLIGFIADGCGDGERSETGAFLGVNFAANATRSLIGLLPITQVNRVLYHQVQIMLRQVVIAQGFIDPAEEARFIKSHLLFTLLGFVIFKGQCLILSSGDGTVVIDDQIELIRQNNKPEYIAYHIVNKNSLYLKDVNLPILFEERLFPVSDFERVAIGSDAWHGANEALLLNSDIWNLGENSRSLNRLMRRLSESKKMFKDDAVMISVEKFDDQSDEVSFSEVNINKEE